MDFLESSSNVVLVCSGAFDLVKMDDMLRYQEGILKKLE